MKKHRFFIFVILLFVFTNLLFNFRSWQEIFSTSGGQFSYGDSALAEFILENNYQNVIHLRNPFIMDKKVFYPYEINLSMNDPGLSNVVYFFFLRPLLDIHKSMLLVVVISIFLTNLCMYLLLVELKIKKSVSALVALSFGFTSTTIYKLHGHYTYTSVYLYPLSFLIILLFFKSKTVRKKYTLSLCLGFLLAFTLLLNFYYFITIGIASFLYVLYSFIRTSDKVIEFFVKNIKFILVAFFTFLVLLIPWLDSVYKLTFFEGSIKAKGFAGSTVLSADLVGFFTPLEYSPLYRFLFLKLGSASLLFAKYTKFYLNSLEKYVYPGAIILLTYIYILFFKKHIPTATWKKVKPFLIISLIFFVFTLGPFLKIGNRWALPLEDGIYLIFPLPFLLLHYTPGLSGLRAPTRFTPIALFFASLVVAYILNFLVRKISFRKVQILLAVLFAIFLVDQYYIPPLEKSLYFPQKAYSYIKDDKVSGTVFEIPFTARDGFTYIGFVHAITPMNGYLYHQKPIIGGYFARINPDVFKYYGDLPFIGYVARTIDVGNYKTLTEQARDIVIQPFTAKPEDVINELNFLDVRYVLIKSDEKYSQAIAKILGNVGFIKKFRDKNYDLYVRNVAKINFERVDFGYGQDYLLLAQGFFYKEDGFRWSEGKISKVFVKTYDSSRKKLIFEASSFYKPQSVTVYINNKKVAELAIGTEKKRYAVATHESLIRGINTIQFTYSKTYRPSDVVVGNKDNRELAIKFYTLKVQ